MSKRGHKSAAKEADPESDQKKAETAASNVESETASVGHTDTFVALVAKAGEPELLVYLRKVKREKIRPRFCLVL